MLKEKEIEAINQIIARGNAAEVKIRHSTNSRSFRRWMII